MSNRFMEKESNLVREDGAKPAGKPSLGDLNSDSYNLHINGFITQEATRFFVGFGIAICRGENDSLLFHMARSLDHDSTITVLEAELIALKLGLTKAVSLGIKHIKIYSDDYQVLELIMERSAPKHENMALLMSDVQRIRQQLTTSIPVFVTRNKYAMESIDICMPPSHTKTCGICFDEKMYNVVLCHHQFCVECMKQYIEVQLLEGRSVLTCPHYGCKTNLNLRTCAPLLTPKVKKMWERRIKQDSIPEWDRFHCPLPNCSAWMSKIKLFERTELDGVKRCCTKCREPFCIYCKVPWHSNLSCEEYKGSCPKPTKTVRRQCKSCQHMIEVSEERHVVTCRCGFKFCSTCGAQWKLGSGCPHHPNLVKHVSIFIFDYILMMFCALVFAFFYPKSKHLDY